MSRINCLIEQYKVCETYKKIDICIVPYHMIFMDAIVHLNESDFGRRQYYTIMKFGINIPYYFLQ